MGKRSGVPHCDEELAALGTEELSAEVARAHLRLKIANSAREVKRWHQRIHWVEAEVIRRS